MVAKMNVAGTSFVRIKREQGSKALRSAPVLLTFVDKTVQKESFHIESSLFSILRLMPSFLKRRFYPHFLLLEKILAANACEKLVEILVVLIKEGDALLPSLAVYHDTPAKVGLHA